MFSPSAARLATSAARDWSYVESWLATQFPNQQMPPFERTPTTLKLLLTMANVNEATTERRRLMCRADSEALQMTYQGTAASKDSIASRRILSSEILEAIEGELSREGRSALESLASMAITAGVLSRSQRLSLASLSEPETSPVMSTK